MSIDVYSLKASYFMGLIDEFVQTWSELSAFWKLDGSEKDPLAEMSPKTTVLESALVRIAVDLLESGGEYDERLFASARQIRNARVGPTIDLRAVIDLSNKCRVNCGFCPMRRDNSHALPIGKANAAKIVVASEDAYSKGFRQLFLQSGEDVTIVRPVLEALAMIRRDRNDWHIILNLGSHRLDVYEKLRAAGADGYLIKHETSNPDLHLKLREESLNKRVHHMLLARKAGMYIGSGNILGLPGQTTEDVARDLIFLGRIGSTKMASCAPFTSSHDLPAALQVTEPGVFEKTLRFLALLRHCFPSARIPATSNLDSPHLIRPEFMPKSGQAMAIDAGANGITVQFTPREIEAEYGLYARGSEKLKDGYLVRLEKARLVAEQTGLHLDLKEPTAGVVELPAHTEAFDGLRRQALRHGHLYKEVPTPASAAVDRAIKNATK
jgi:biotin synthase